jgi:hypothetical protein
MAQAIDIPEVELHRCSLRQFWNSRRKDNHHPNLAEVKLVIATVIRPPLADAGRKLKKIFNPPPPDICLKNSTRPAVTLP